MSSSYPCTELEKEMAMLDGKPPYDGPENPCRGDAYYATSLQRKYGATIEELRRRVKIEGPRGLSSGPTIALTV